MNGLDRWITGGRPRSELILVKCPDCEELDPRGRRN